MRKHNTLLGQATLPKKQFTRPKQVLTGGVLGNTGRGLSYQQYQGLVKGIDGLKDATTVQRKEYDEYVDYNEKATVRSDYNIEDITRLAKSLEHIIDDLRNKWKVQQKWNSYFNFMISNASDPTNTNVIIDDRVTELKQQINELQRQITSGQDNSAIIELRNEFDQITVQAKNILRVLQSIPGIVTSLDSICNRTENGFEIKYKTINFKDIDLNAALPKDMEDPDENDGDANPDAGEPDASLPTEGGGGDPPAPGGYNPDEDDRGQPIPPEGEPAFSQAQKETILVSPVDMKFSKLYAESTKLTDINKALTETKTAIEQIKTAITSLQSSTPTVTIVYVATINVYENGPVVVNSRGSSSDMKFSCSSDRCRLTLNVTSTSTPFRIESAVCNLKFAENHADFGGGEHNGNGPGAMSVLACRAYSSSTTNWSVDVYQFAQGNANNNSWYSPQWGSDRGVFTIDVIAFGTIGTTSSSSSPTVNITPPTVPTTADFSPSCGDKTEVEIKPEPAPEPEPEP